MTFDFLHSLGTFGIIPFLVVLTIVVFFHEFGHFLVAR
jgi:membrane-associated protease RseP (regulator of RpoE activity)